MRSLILISIASAAGVGCGVLLLVVASGHPRAGPPAPAPTASASTSDPAPAIPPTEGSSPASPPARVEPRPPPEATQTLAARKAPETSPADGAPRADPEPAVGAEEARTEPPVVGSVPLPQARMALALVGFDEEAEKVWIRAINDPLLSAHDRQDLIEDLNEEGFVDPKHITVDDLPLILNRLAIIERLGPEAMDDVNAEAFREAYRDLVNMLLGRSGR